MSEDHYKGTAVSYVRFSSSEQSKGSSYKRQIDAAEKYCAKHGLTLLDEGRFFDEGVSGFSGKNRKVGQLGDILDQVKNGTIKPGTRLLVEDLDRLGRDRITSQLSTFTDLLNSGIHIVTLGDSPKEYAAVSGLPDFILALIQMGLAHGESAKKSERLSEAWRIKRERIGEEPLTSVCPYWIKKQGKKMVLIPERALVIQEIFEMALSGLGRRSIARSLNEKQVPVFGSTKRNKAIIWGGSYISKVLKNRATIGEFQPHTRQSGVSSPVGDPILNYYPAAISEETFLAVQERMKARAGRGGRPPTIKTGNLFTSRLRCWHCGGTMHFQDKGDGPRNPNKLKYVVCKNKYLAKTCNAQSVRYGGLEKSILRELTQIDWPALIEGKAKPVGDEMAAMKGKISDLTQKIENLLTVLADGAVSPSLTDRLTQFESDKAEISKALLKLKEETNTTDQLRRMSLDAAEETEKFMVMAENPEHRPKLKKMIGDLMHRSYVAFDGDKYFVAMILANGGFGLVNGDLRFKYECDGDGLDLDGCLTAILEEDELETLKRLEPDLALT